MHQYSSINFFCHSYTAEGLHDLWADDNSKESWNTHEYNRTIRNESMTSANGAMRAGQYPCDGGVDNLEPTLLKTIICFGCRDIFRREPLMNYLQDKNLDISN